MQQLTSSQIKLLTLLGDGALHSGSELGQALNITRSAIWKQINQLIAFGIPIISLAQQGYQLQQPMILLEKERISHHLAQQLPGPFCLHVFTSIDSTNRFLKELPLGNQIDICCAEFQTQGRGRFGRTWHSPFGENIYCSSRWSLNCDLSKLAGLSLITSLAILATLKELNLPSDIKVKWPNDLYWGDKKLCGSLIEIMAESNGALQVIIGIGLNVNTDTKEHPLADKPWCSLYEVSNKQFDRNLLIASLIVHLERYLNRFIHYDLSVFMEEWEQADYLAGKNITVTQSSGVLSGKACGINAIGQLILEDDSGTQHMLSSGDTSLKAEI